MSDKLKTALIRALRTYLVVAGPLLIGVASSDQISNFAAWKVAAASGIPALLAFLWRYYLDPTAIPSLVDLDQKKMVNQKV
jgi:hypothetical protein